MVDIFTILQLVLASFAGWNVNQPNKLSTAFSNS